MRTHPPTSFPRSDYDMDSEIVAGFLQGEGAAVHRIAGWAREIARHRAWGDLEAEDLVQESLLALMRNLQTHRFAPGNLRAYVRRITKNRCISAYRRRRTAGRDVPTEEPLADARPGAGGAGTEVRAMLARVLATLDEACRRLLILAYLHGLARAEIALRLGISEGAARVRLHRCLERARRGQAGAAGKAQSNVQGALRGGSARGADADLHDRTQP